MSKVLSRQRLLEGVTIVISILLAFSIDASWGSYQEFRARSNLIKQLKADFEVTGDRLRESIGAARSHTEQNTRFLEIISNGETISRDRFSELAYSFVAVQTFEPALDTYEAVGRDGLSSVHSPALTRSIAEFYENLETFDHHLRVFTEIYYLGSLNEIRYQAGSWGVLLRGEESCIGRTCVFPEEFEMTMGELRDFVQRPAIYAGFESSRVVQLNLLASLEAMETANTKILAELELLR
jgi:hypothetical protein